MRQLFFEPFPCRTRKIAMKTIALWQVSSELNSQYAAQFGAASNSDTDSHSPQRVVDELSLRTGPIRQQWEARGPGLLAALSQRLRWLTWSEPVTIALVQPIRHGGGWIQSSSTICFEALLANPLPELPEVVRLGWFLAQLAVQRTLEGVIPLDSTTEGRLATALIPPVLSAAEHVELSSAEPLTIQMALLAWTGQDAAAARSVNRWWKLHQAAVFHRAEVWWQAVTDLY